MEMELLFCQMDKSMLENLKMMRLKDMERLTIQGDKYEGEFKNGQLNGKGTLILSNGDEYVGDFKDGMTEW